MPGSGMGLVSRLLGGIGLDLGPASDTFPPGPNGNGRFTLVNGEILRAVGAVWSSTPPRGTDWGGDPQLEALRRSTARHVDALALSEPWGWADPRNSLTLPFWRELFPDLRLLVAVRHPCEVAGALVKSSGISSEEALDLWEEYYGTVFELCDEASFVTHYDSYRRDPTAELDRVARALGLGASRVAVASTAAGLKLPPSSAGATEGRLPPRLETLHARLLEAANSGPPKVAPPRNAPSGEHDDQSGRLAAQRHELEHLRLELARARSQIEALRAQLEVRSLEPVDLREIALGLEQQLADRDQELEELRKALSEGDSWRREMEAAMRDVEDWAKALLGELEMIKSTRVWSVGKRYWALKERLR
jgi:hypothetical protein